MRKYNVKVNGTLYEVEIEEVKDEPGSKENIIKEKEEEIRSSYSGEIKNILVHKNLDINIGDELMVIVSNGVEKSILSKKTGRLKEILVEEGSKIQPGDLLILIN